MNWTTARPWAATAVRVALAAVWFLAAWAKLNEPRTFLRTVRVYDATPEWLSKAIAYGLPVLELCLAALLLAGLATRWAAAVSAVLLLIFAIGIAQASI
nr:DoxX family membrane protein [Actinomycetota bacterium]